MRFGTWERSERDSVGVLSGPVGLWMLPVIGCGQSGSYHDWTMHAPVMGWPEGVTGWRKRTTARGNLCAPHQLVVLSIQTPGPP